MAGIGVDAGGRIVGYLRVCSHHVDGATLYHEQEDHLGSWTAPNHVTDFTSWTLGSPPSGWKADPPLAGLLPATDYTLYGWTSDNSSSAAGVSFTLEKLSTLTPDHVMHWSGTNSGGDVYKVDSVEEFRRSACAAIR
ncbi:hypothetical protein [Jatrophihabitans sp.]|uniref:hypothetical protein n=1 Tax=Jatrophihabitans sp. TaxID=1932789 RepID=UPI002F0B696C